MAEMNAVVEYVQEYRPEGEQGHLRAEAASFVPQDPAALHAHRTPQAGAITEPPAAVGPTEHADEPILVHVLEFNADSPLFYTALEQSGALKGTADSLKGSGHSSRPLGLGGPHFFGPSAFFEPVAKLLREQADADARRSLCGRHVIAVGNFADIVLDAVHHLQGRDTQGGQIILRERSTMSIPVDTEVPASIRSQLGEGEIAEHGSGDAACLLYTSPSPRDS